MSDRTRDTSHAPNRGPGGCVPWEEHERAEDALYEIADMKLNMRPQFVAREALTGLDELDWDGWKDRQRVPDTHHD